MKKYILSIMLLVLVATGAVAQNNSMCVYRSDGIINAFWKTEIDSIKHSCIDIDSVAHPNAVVQEIWTADSVYRIPLEIIDSVSFVTPETVYKPGVIDIADDLLKYIIRVDSMTIVVYGNTPTSLIPKAGDKLVFAKESRLFPYGFAGEVVNIQIKTTEIAIECKIADLEEIFESYFNLSTTYCYSDSDISVKERGEKKNIENAKEGTYKIDPITLDYSTDLTKNITSIKNLVLPKGVDLQAGAKFVATINPVIKVRSSYIITRERGIQYDCYVKCDNNIELSSTIYGGLSYSKDFLDKDIINIPLGQPFVKFYLKPGLYVNASAVVEGSHNVSLDNYIEFSYHYCNRGVNNFQKQLQCNSVPTNSSWSVCLDGNIGFGAFCELGFNLLYSDLAKVCARGELGAELTGHAVLYDSDMSELESSTRLYEKLKSSSITMNAVGNVSLVTGVLNNNYSISPLHFGFTYPIFTKDIVPTFSDTKFTWGEDKHSADALVEMKGDCLVPVTVGFSLLDEESKKYEKIYSNEKFTNGRFALAYTYDDLKYNKRYRLYPLIKFLGIDVLASPSADLETGITVNTDEVGHITTTGAIAGGDFSSDVQLDDVVCGICYSQDGVNWIYSKAFNIDGSGLFMSKLEGLSPNTYYNYKAYVYVGGEYYYGETLSFTTDIELVLSVQTEYAIAQITTADIGGSVSSNKPGIEYEYGICYSKDGQNWTKVNAGNRNEEGYFIVHIDKLDQGTQYYCKAFVCYGGICLYGEVLSFETDVELEITAFTDEARDITETSAVLGGHFTSNKEIEGCEVGICISENSTDWWKFTAGTVMPEEQFTITIDELSPNTKYYYAAYVRYNDNDEEKYEYGEVLSFETDDSLKISAYTNDARDVTETGATLGGYFTCNKDIEGYECGVCVSEDNVTWTAYESDGALPDVGFEINLEGCLSPETKYYYATYVRYEEKYYWGEVKEFSTGEITVETVKAESHGTSAQIYGRIALCNTLSDYEYGICYSKDEYTWKYVAGNNIDEYGDYKVSLTDLSTSKTYYCKAYLYYGEQYYYGSTLTFETSLFSCPDSNHPHAIDLGLPSGTKWCCCNVGASTPEGYGGYYAWGETSEKSVYNWDTYAYYNSSTGIVNIGSDIAGTSYDVAHVKMGGSWRMPSHEQQLELMNNCTRKWTQQNGVNGILVTGPNGGQVFLPAAGGRWDVDLYSAGSYGFYWSSSLDPGGRYFAYYLSFRSGGWSWDDYSRDSGPSVRAVCP